MAFSPLDEGGGAGGGVVEEVRVIAGACAVPGVMVEVKLPGGKKIGSGMKIRQKVKHGSSLRKVNIKEINRIGIIGQGEC